MRALKYNIKTCGFEIPYSDNTYVLSTPLKISDKAFTNRIAIIAPFGGDAKATGEFSIYSHRRYARFAGEGAGVIFTEPVALLESMKRNNGQLCLNERTLNNFKDEIEFIKKLSVSKNNIFPNVILKLDLPVDSSNTNYSMILSTVCFLAEKAGFDGVETDLRCNIDNSALLTMKSNVSNNFTFAVGLNDYKSWNESLRKIFEQKKIFDNLIVTVDLKGDKKQLDVISNNVSLISSLQKQNPDITVLTYGYSEFGSEGGSIAAGFIDRGVCKLCGFSKQAVAYPSFIRDLIAGGLDKTKCCKMCGKCEQLQSAGMMSGCVVFDGETYLPYYDKITI